MREHQNDHDAPLGANLVIRISDADEEAIAAAVQASGVTKSELMRRCLQYAMEHPEGPVAAGREALHGTGVTVQEAAEAHSMRRPRCFRCGRGGRRVSLLIDYVRPWDWGGSNSADNAQILCEQCYALRSEWVAGGDFRQRIAPPSSSDDALLDAANSGPFDPVAVIGKTTSRLKKIAQHAAEAISVLEEARISATGKRSDPGGESR